MRSFQNVSSWLCDPNENQTEKSKWYRSTTNIFNKALTLSQMSTQIADCDVLFHYFNKNIVRLYRIKIKTVCIKHHKIDNVHGIVLRYNGVSQPNLFNKIRLYIGDSVRYFWDWISHHADDHRCAVNSLCPARCAIFKNILVIGSSSISCWFRC